MAYTTIDDPSAYFQTALYTGGNGSNNTPIDVTNSGNSDLQPDWVWIKRRDGAASHGLFDSSRGVNKILNSDSTDAEVTGETDLLDEFKTDGFGLGANTGSENVNKGGTSYVAWQWKANGGTTASNTDGSITSTVQANTTAGFSIVTYTGNGSDNATVGHGLGVKPKVIIPKRRDSSGNWLINDWSGDYVNKLKLNATELPSSSDSFVKDASSTTFTLGTDVDVNASSGTYIAYCFAEKQGYSKMNIYEGNNNADGAFIYLGFRPSFMLIKNIDGTNNWMMLDNKRDTDNPVLNALVANGNGAEFADSGDLCDFLSNGVKMRVAGQGTNNAATFIYLAFASSPFVSSEGVPTTAR